MDKVASESPDCASICMESKLICAETLVWYSVHSKTDLKKTVPCFLSPAASDPAPHYSVQHLVDKIIYIFWL